MRSWLRRLIWALPLAGVLLLGADRDAQASLFACFQALAPLEQAKNAAEVAAKAGSCSAQATSDPVMAMTIAALTAAAIGGAFSSTSQCNALINGAVGKVVATALLTLPWPADLKNLLAAYVNGTSPLTFQEIVDAFPILNAVIGYIHCGCAVAGAPGEYEKIAKEYAQNVKSCGNFAADALNTIASGFGSVAEDIAEALNGPALKPGIQQEQTCWVQTLPDEIWTATPIYTSSTFQCNVIRCAPGKVVIKKTSAGKTLNKCAASCPDPIKTFQPGGLCYGTVNSKPVEGVCAQVPGVVHCCGDGQKVAQWGVCSPACSDGIQFWDVKAGKCSNCPAGWGPTYQSASSSVGACVECPIGQTYDFASKKCEPLNCKSPSYFDPKSLHACATCAPGQTYSAKSGKCECGIGTFPKGAGCVCPKNANKVNFAASFTCTCPTGSTFDPIQLACVCPTGQQMQIISSSGSVYSTCLQKSGPVLTPPKTPPVVTCPPGTRLVKGVCRPTAPAKPSIVPRQPTPSAPGPLFMKPVLPAPVVRCPSGTVPNATQRGCVPTPPPLLMLPPIQQPPPPPPPARMLVPTQPPPPPPPAGMMVPR